MQHHAGDMALCSCVYPTQRSLSRPDADTTDVADTVHNSTLVVDQYTPEDFLAPSHRISDTFTYTKRWGVCADRLGRSKRYVNVVFVRLYQIQSLTKQAQKIWKNIFFCRVSDPYGISYRLEWSLARVFANVSGHIQATFCGPLTARYQRPLLISLLPL